MAPSVTLKGDLIMRISIQCTLTYHLLLIVLAVTFFTPVRAALLNDGSIRLTIDPGVPSCVLDVGIFPDCSFGVEVLTGSFSGFTSSIENAITGDQGIVLGAAQPFNGTLSTSSYDGSGSNITQAFVDELMNYGTNSSSLPILANNVGNLDITGWRTTYNNLFLMDVGGDDSGSFICSDPVGGNVRAIGNCQVGDNYVFDSSSTIVSGAWSGVPFTLHLEGMIKQNTKLFFTETGQIPDSPVGTSGHQGVAWIDYDNDGDMDLFVPKHSGSNRLFRNDNNGTQFIDVTANSPAIRLITSISVGAAIGDYNGDGYDDIFVTNRLLGNFLFRNSPDLVNPGQRMFVDVTNETQVGNELKDSMSAAFGDLNGDGYLDIYVSNFKGGPCDLTNQNDLYINIPDPNDITKRQFQRQAVHDSDLGCSWVSALTDYDNDGDLDIFVVNDVFFNTDPSVPGSELFHNDLTETGSLSFRPVAATVGLNDRVAGMGIAIGDYNNNGLLDYYQTDLVEGTLATQNTDNTFTNQRIMVADYASYGWGAVFFDADQDGFEDLYSLSSNHAFGEGDARSSFYLNNGIGGFSETSGTVGLMSGGVGVATADYDNDGDIDMVVHGDTGIVRLYRNNTVLPSNFLRIRLKGKTPNHRGIGARVTATLNNGMVLTREVHAGTSLGSTHSPIVHFGLGLEISVSSVIVYWPQGCTQTLANITANQIISVNELGCYAPTISSFSTQLFSGTLIVTINGDKLDTATDVKFFNNVAAQIFSQSATTLIVAAPFGAATGPITVITPQGQAISPDNFIAPPLPVIQSFSPTTNVQTGLETIYGSNLQYVSGVTINGLSAEYFSTIDGTRLFISLPVGVTSGEMVLKNISGIVSSAVLNIIPPPPPPVIGSFVPPSAAPGQVIQIHGSDLRWIRSVHFNGTWAPNYLGIGDILYVLVPPNVTTGSVSVLTISGEAVSGTDFVVQ